MSICLMLATVGMISAFNTKSGRRTPATVNRFFSDPVPGMMPFSAMARPTTFGSELNRRFQNPWLRTTTAGLPGMSSSGSSRRP